MSGAKEGSFARFTFARQPVAVCARVGWHRFACLLKNPSNLSPFPASLGGSGSCRSELTKQRAQTSRLCGGTRPGQVVGTAGALNANNGNLLSLSLSSEAARVYHKLNKLLGQHFSRAVPFGRRRHVSIRTNVRSNRALSSGSGGGGGFSQWWFSLPLEGHVSVLPKVEARSIRIDHLAGWPAALFCLELPS